MERINAILGDNVNDVFLTALKGVRIIGNRVTFYNLFNSVNANMLSFLLKIGFIMRVSILL